MRGLSILMVALVFVSGCAESPEPTDRTSNCKRGRAHACQRVADCKGLSPLDPATTAFVGACTETTQANECTPDRLICPDTETYHPDQDVACASAFSEWSCDAIVAAGDHFPTPPAPCEMICQ